MNDETRDLEVDSRHFVLATSEYLSTSSPRYKLIRAELMEGGQVALCMFGIDVLFISTQYINKSDEEIKETIRSAIGNALINLVTKDDFKSNKTYYGTHMTDGSFKVSTERPSWEDGNWGTLLK